MHGLAHKVEFQAEYLHAQANQSMTQFPLYDPLDDNQIEDFRRRFTVNTFGFPAVPPPLTQGPPTKFDERFYAVRSDMEGSVTAPSMEIADDLDEVRLGIHQRWQTKRGPRRKTPTSSTGSSSTRTSRSSPMPTATTSARASA